MPHPKTVLVDLLARALTSVAPQHSDDEIHIERPKDRAHGDYASNIALQLARRLKQSPRHIASQLVDNLPSSPLVEHSEVAGAGFINFRLTQSARMEVVWQVLQAGVSYGQSDIGARQKVLLEYVSANPTGPLHVGHGRGAAYGAALARLLEFADFDVTEEYYVNDAGRQMDILALSTWLRYLQLLASDSDAALCVAFPANAYQGEYVVDMARQIKEAHADAYWRDLKTVATELPEQPDAERGDPEAVRGREEYLDALIIAAKSALGPDWDYIHQHALSEQLADCRNDLQEFGISIDLWFSERSLFDTGLVAGAVEKLQQKGYVYQQDGARWFRSTAFGDEKDRVVQRENGAYTYFASDIAYHLNKFERGFERVINVWGADHHGYIARVKGVLKALELDDNLLQVALVQFAVLYRNGEKVPMSSRGGKYVSLRQLREEVGNDACRFFYSMRKSDQHLDFDLDLAKSQNSDNPVYYIQYAHARIASLLRQESVGITSKWELLAADGQPGENDVETLAQAVQSDQAQTLVNLLADFPEVISHAATELAPHQLSFYLRETAAAFHGWYNAERIITSELEESRARMALAAATRQVIANGCRILGVSCPDSM